MSTADELKKLADLKEQGVLTEAEFERQKRQLLETPNGAPSSWTPRPPSNASYPATGRTGSSPPLLNPISVNRTNSTSTAALILAFLFWPLGIIYGHVSRSQIRRTGERGAGRALAALIISYIEAAVVVVAIVVFLASSQVVSVASSQGGFNDLGTLQNSVSQQLNSNLHDSSNAAYSPGTSVTSTFCVHSGGTQYSCIVKASDGSSTTLSVTVSSDGSRWVTN
jgi:hypothetical protein